MLRHCPLPVARPLFPVSLLCLAALLAGTSPAQAMSIRTRLFPVAFSEDGASVLVRSALSGPEGGGELTYEVWGTTAPHRLKVTLSSTMSPGDGSTPEHVDGKSCAAAARTLDAALKARGFRGVKVRAERCGAHVDDVVVVEPRHGKAIAEAQFRARGGKLAQGGVEVRFRSGEVGIYRDEAKVCAFAQPKRDTPAELFVSGTATGRLIFAIERTSSGDEGLLGLCGGVDHKLATLPTDAR